MKIKLTEKTLDEYNLRERFTSEIMAMPETDQNRYYYKYSRQLLKFSDFDWFFLPEFDLIVREKKVDEKEEESVMTRPWWM